MQTRVEDESQSLINYELCYTFSPVYHALCWVNAPSMIKNAYACKNIYIYIYKDAFQSHQVAEGGGGALVGGRGF